MKTIAGTFLLILTVLCFTIGVSAATFVVNTTNDTQDVNAGDGVCADSGSNCSFRAAISEANAFAGDDTITLPAGTYTQTIFALNEDLNTGGDWDIRGNITINGAGPASILQATTTPDTAEERVLHSVFSSNIVTINGVTIRHGKKQGAGADISRGGGIFNPGDLTINDSVITANKSVNGGGIYNTGNLTINNSTVFDNRCEDPSWNTCHGGGIYNRLTATKNITIAGSVINGNTARGFGFSPYGYGGGMGLETPDGVGVNLNISNTTVDGNLGYGPTVTPGTGAGFGGGLYLNLRGNSTVNISGTTIRNNHLSGGPGGVGGGIAIYSSGSGSLTGTMDKVTVSGNAANQSGIGIFIGAFNSSTVAFDIKNSTISGNTPELWTSAGGGGIYVTGNSTSNTTVNFLNTTISGNTAGVGAGAGLANLDTSNLIVNFDFCTIAGNATLDQFTGGGGGISRVTGSGATGSVNLKNTVIADNSAANNSGHDISGSLTSQGYNHVENTANPSGTFSPGPTDSSGFDPQLGPLQDNGGPTLTRLLAPSSPLVNKIPDGTNGCGTATTSDQRGQVRPFGSGCEVGSVERGALPAGPWTLSGTVKTTEGIPIRNVAVQISGGNLPAPITVFTGNFGTYQFTNLAGNDYTVTVTAKRFHFNDALLVFSVGSNITNADFIANAPFSRVPLDLGLGTVKGKAPK